MNKDGTRSLWDKGEEAWNAWALERLQRKTALEEAGSWSVDWFGEGQNSETEAWLSEAKADFEGVEFAADADFESFVFPGPAIFDGAHFLGKAQFANVHFAHSARFQSARFDGEASFKQVKFYHLADFDEAAFASAADFEKPNSSARRPGRSSPPRAFRKRILLPAPISAAPNSSAMPNSSAPSSAAMHASTKPSSWPTAISKPRCSRRRQAL